MVRSELAALGLGLYEEPGGTTCGGEMSFVEDSPSISPEMSLASMLSNTEMNLFNGLEREATEVWEGSRWGLTTHTFGSAAPRLEGESL